LPIERPIGGSYKRSSLMATLDLSVALTGPISALSLMPRRCSYRRNMIETVFCP
jgi:hypothetical protein